MPDLYPIPGFGPEEILEMARSAIRQANDYKIRITLHEPAVEWNTEADRCKSLDNTNALAAWAEIDRTHYKPLVIKCQMSEHDAAKPVPSSFAHTGIYSRQTEMYDYETLHCPIFRPESVLRLEKGRYIGSTKALTSSRPLKITAKNHND